MSAAGNTTDRLVVIGAGQGGLTAAVTAREHGFEGSIVVLNGEPDEPYQRPPLSKDFQLDPTAQPSLIRHRSILERLHVDVRQARASAIDPRTRAIGLDDGDELGYEHLVVASGARPRDIPIEGTTFGGVHVIRTVADARALRADLAGGPDVVVIGAGFQGLELATVALQRGCSVSVLEAEPRVLPRVCTQATADLLRERHELRGLDIVVNARAARLLPDAHGNVSGVELADGRTLNAEVVVICGGVVPNDGLLAEESDPGGGILVDRSLRTLDGRTFAIGDCARFPSPVNGSYVRIESVQNAVDQAHHVGRQLAGQPRTPYAALPWFWSHQGESKIQIVGLIPNDAESDVAIQRNGDAFAAYVFSNGGLVAVETVNWPREHMRWRRAFADDPGTGRSDEALALLRA